MVEEVGQIRCGLIDWQENISMVKSKSYGALLKSGGAAAP